MKQRGRKSAASHVAVLTGRQPTVACPSTLTEREQTVWRATVARLPAGIMQPEMVGIGAAYCRQSVDAEQLREMAMAEGVDPGDALRLIALSQKAAGLALAHARALRMTPQSRTHPETAGRMASESRAAPLIDWQGYFKAKRDHDERDGN